MKKKLPTRVLFEFDDYRIVIADRSNVELQHMETIKERIKGKVTGRERQGWVFVGYHGKTSGALKHMVDELPRNSKTLDEAIDLMELLLDKIDKMETIEQ